MSLILLDGCEDFSAFAQASAVISPGRYQQCVRLASGAQLVYRPLVSQEFDTVTIGFAFRHVTQPANNLTLLNLYGDNGSTIHNRLTVLPSGAFSVERSSTTLATSSVGLVTIGIWYYIEVQYRLHDTLGAITVRLNGATVLTFGPGDTKNAGTKTVYDTIQWITNSTHAIDIDDVYICTAATTPDPFLDSITVETVLPNGNGAASEWFGSDANSVDNYLLVDDPHPISLNDYVYSTTVGDQDLYTLANLVHTTGTIVGVCHSAQMVRTDAATPMNVKLINRGAVDTASAAIPMTTSYRDYNYVLTADPETAAPWTIAAVNVLQTGVELA